MSLFSFFLFPTPPNGMQQRNDLWKNDLLFVWFSFAFSIRKVKLFMLSFVEVRMKKAEWKLSQTHFTAIYLARSCDLEKQANQSLKNCNAWWNNRVDLWFMSGVNVSHRKAIKLAVSFFMCLQQLQPILSLARRTHHKRNFFISIKFI